MSSDFIVTTGHLLQITMDPPETYPSLIAPIPLVGSSVDFKVLKMPVCLEGDETPSLLLAPQPYISPTFYTVPGMGMVSLKLGDSNKTAKTKKSGKAILVTGQVFDVEFNVTVPAILINEMSGVTVTDSAVKKTGKAVFINTNTIVKAE